MDDVGLQGHTRDVQSVAYSPDGKQLVSGSTDETVRVWQVASGKCIATLKVRAPHGCTQTYIQRSNRSRIPLEGVPIAWLVACVPLFIYVHRFCAFPVVAIIQVGPGLGFVLFSGLQGHTGEVNSVAFSKDGKQVVSGGEDRTLHIRDVPDGLVHE